MTALAIKQPLFTHPVNILLIEDNLGDVELTIAAFGELELNHNFHNVRDGHTALEYLHKKGDYANAVRPDLILLDLNLPKKNGWEILHNIKQDSALKAIPVIVLTNSKDDKDIVMCYMLHANCYVVKPLSFKDYVKVIQSMETFWLHTAVRLP
jgi:CheY-like chemotaxis protein